MRRNLAAAILAAPAARAAAAQGELKLDFGVKLDVPKPKLIPVLQDRVAAEIRARSARYKAGAGLAQKAGANEALQEDLSMRHSRSAARPIQVVTWIIALTSALAAGCRYKVPEQAVYTLSQPPSKTTAELRTIHQDISANASQCLSCHSDKILADSKDPSFPAFHKLHIEKADGPECTTCHVSFDMVVRPRVHVADRSTCTSGCHESLASFRMGR